MFLFYPDSHTKRKNQCIHCHNHITPVSLSSTAEAWPDRDPWEFQGKSSSVTRSGTGYPGQVQDTDDQETRN